MSEEKQREKQKAYEKYVKKITPVHNLPFKHAESIPDWRTDLCSRSAYPEHRIFYRS